MLTYWWFLILIWAYVFLKCHQRRHFHSMKESQILWWHQWQIGTSCHLYSSPGLKSVCWALILESHLHFPLSHEPCLKQWPHKAQFQRIYFHVAWPGPVQSWAMGVCLVLPLRFLLHLMMCTDVLSKHPKRLRDTAQYPCSQMMLPYRISFWATSSGML